MTDNLNVYKYCSRCKGSGEVPVGDQPYDPEGGNSNITCPKM